MLQSREKKDVLKNVAGSYYRYANVLREEQKRATNSD